MKKPSSVDPPLYSCRATHLEIQERQPTLRPSISHVRTKTCCSSGWNAQSISPKQRQPWEVRSRGGG
jgi:hypothetical protein